MKFSFNEQREYAVIDAELEEIADKIADYDTQIAASVNDYVKLQELLAQKEALERLQDEKTERWLYLNELAERWKRKSETHKKNSPRKHVIASGAVCLSEREHDKVCFLWCSGKGGLPCQVLRTGLEICVCKICGQLKVSHQIFEGFCFVCKINACRRIFLRGCAVV